MADRNLILGRAGAGKTRLVMDRLAAFLREGREREALLLVPTLSQASHIKRLFLTRYRDLAGFFDASVVTFTSLAEKVLPDRPIGELLSGLRLDLFLWRVLARSGNEAFRRLGRYPGFRRSALAFLKELKQNGLTAEETVARLEGLAATSPPAVRDRLEGFRDLFTAYESERTGAGLIDHEDYLRETRDALADTASRPTRELLALELFAVDGFQNFTSLERDLLLLVADRATETLVTLPWDSRLDAERGRQFRVAAETHDFLIERGFSRRPLAENHRALTPDLAHLERNLFAPDPRPVATEGTILMLEGADPADEADRVARTVIRLVRGDFGKAFRYQDVVVVVREVTSREDRFRAAFARHGVPLRIYGSESLAGHPFVRAAVDLLTLAGGRFETPTVRGFLRSDHVTGIDPAAIDRFEADLVEHGTPADPEAWFERAAACSGEAGERLAALASFDPAPRDGAAWERALLTLVATHLAPLAERDLSDVPRVRRDAQAIAAFRSALAETARALDGVETFPTFLGMLRDVLRTAVAGTRDRRLAVVNLIGAREARQWEAPVVIVAGLTEGEFPRAPREDLFVPDADRRRANEERHLALRERALDREEERYLFYVAMTRARERLILSWPATDGAGREALRSLYVEDVLRLFEGAEDLISRRRLSDALALPEETTGRDDLRKRALLGLATVDRGGGVDRRRGRMAVALHDRFVAQPDVAYVRAVRRGAWYYRPRTARLVDPTRLPARRRHSASALEDFAQCPFRYFAGRTLRLDRPSGAGEFDVRLRGEIVHEALAILFAGMTEGEGPPDPADVAPLVAELIDARAASVPRGLVESRHRREMVRSLTALVTRERARLAASRWRPNHLEAGFGRGDPGLSVAGPEGERIPLIGFIDRIDTDGEGGGLVIDYKYSTRGFDGARKKAVTEGAHFQLPVYLLALRDAFGLAPRGAWLYPVRDPRTSGYVTPAGPPADRPVPVTDEDVSELLDATVAWIADYDARIREGEIDIRPKDTKACAWCDFADLCRFEAWMGDGAGDDGNGGGIR